MISSNKLDLTGQQVGAYQLVRLIGEGGMGSVYESFQDSVNRKVAVKVLTRQLAQVPGYLERFKREAKMAARREHKHVSTFYD